MKKFPASNNNSTQLTDNYHQLTERYNALLQLNTLLHECDNSQTFYQKVHQILSSLMTADNFYIALCDRKFDTLEYVYYVDQINTTPKKITPIKDLKGQLCHRLIDFGQPQALSIKELDALYRQGEITYLPEDLMHWLGVPLMEHGVIVGIVVVQSYQIIVRDLIDDLDILSFIAQQIQIGRAKFNAQEQLKAAVDARTQELMFQIREREHAELLQESLFKISELSNNSSLAIERFYNQVHNIVGQLINSENFYIAKYDDHENTLTFVYLLDQHIEFNDKKNTSRKLSNHLTELVIKRRTTQLLTPNDLQELHIAGEISHADLRIKSWLGVPLETDGEIIGVMAIQSYQPDVIYNDTDAELLNFVARHVASAIKRRELIDFERKSHELLEVQVKLRTKALEAEIKQREKAEEQLTYAASHDSLTGLPNRAVFLDMLNHAIACRKRNPKLQFALLFLDLDRFKVVNDSLGHHAGDALLKLVAKTLTNIVREQDTVARLGGDEFVILIEDLTDSNEAFEVANRITELLNEPIVVDNTPVFIGSSIGVLLSDDRYQSADTMLRDADTAMYQAKEKGKGRFEVFDTSMQLKVQKALTLEADIREAINQAEFEPYFQPIVRLTDKKIVGFETLARWQSKKRGFVYPNDFIPIAEETGLVNEIDLQLLEKSCEILKNWQRTMAIGELYISCNLFGDQFFRPTLADEIIAIIMRVGIKPKHLRIELTERALLENNDIVLTNMNQLKALGVKILLDDFGTGFSSLSYLHRFPIDVLKIDRSFIAKLDDQDKHRAIVKTIIDLAANLEMATVAEGIEQADEATVLCDMGCKYGQGYYFEKPMSALDVINQKLIY